MPSRRLLVLGVGPLPHESEEKLFAPGLRVDFIARELAKAGHEVTVGRALFEDLSGGDVGEAKSPDDDATAKKLPFKLLDIALDSPDALRITIAAMKADAVIACTDPIAMLTTRARPPVPVLVDYFGDPMNERQLQGLRAGNDAALLDGFSNMAPALLGADRFTVCCDAHRHALAGQLGLVGRLNRHASKVEMIHQIRPAWSFQFPEPDGASPEMDEKLATIPQDAFKILFTGGYNNWMDGRTLFEGLEAAMDAVPNAHYLSTGGAIPGHAEGMYAEFRNWIDASRHRERFHFLGWVRTADMPRIYQAADVAVNADIPSFEGEFGTRNRLLDWAMFGTVCVTTTLCDLAQKMEAAGAAATFPMGDSAKLAERLIDLAQNPERRAAIAEKASSFLADWRANAMDPAFLEWAADPRPAPDLPDPADRPNLPYIAPDNSLARHHAEAAIQGAVSAHLADRGSRLYRLYRKLKRGSS